MRIASIVMAILALSAGSAEAAPTPLKAQRLGSASALELGGDAARFAAWPTADRTATVIYDVLSRSRHVIPRPEGCEQPVIGARALVYTCSGTFPGIGTARLLDLRTGVVREVVGDPTSAFGFTPSRSFVAAGTRWIQATVSDYHYSASQFYSRATGSNYDGPSPFGRRVRPDLDSRALRVALCAPIVAQRNSDNDDGFVPPQVAGRFVLEVIGADAPGRTTLVIQRCGTRRHRVICRRWCSSPVIDRGQVLWTDDYGVLHVLAVGSHRARTFAIPGHPITAVHPFAHRLILGTSLFGDAHVQVRITPRPRAARTLRRS